MEPIRLLHMEPTLEMLAEAMAYTQVPARISGRTDGTRFRGVRLYSPGAEGEEGVLFVVRAEEAMDYCAPWPCACPTPVKRCACLVCPGVDAAALLDRLSGLFQRWQAWERRLDELVYRNVGLAELCDAGTALLENPVCVHDDWFVMIARSRELAEVLPPEYIMSSTREFIPRIIIEDFKNDAEYLETYAHRSAQLWDSTPGQPPCLYVNLWDGEVYRGRLLAVKYRRDFQLMDYRAAEVLAQRVMSLLDRKRLGVDRPHRSMDDIIYDLLHGMRSEAEEVNRMLEALGWGREDRMLCVRLASQRPEDNAVLEHALHSELFQAFPSGYIMFTERQQCVLLNLTRYPMKKSMVSHALAPLCRDYCLYAGISSPVKGIAEWTIAFNQAEIALNQAFRLRSERWIIAFSECALDLLLGSVQPPLLPRHLVAPELVTLMEYDAEKGTQYFDTLKAYIIEERDIPRTSEKLIIHRTTLLYRLKKIETIAPVRLDNPATRLYLLLSLRILEREGMGMPV